MAGEGLRILVALGLNDTEFNAKLNAATKKLQMRSREMIREGRRLSIASRELFMGMTLPLGLLGKTVFDATAQMERLRQGLETVGRSKGIENITELTEQVRELAKLPGLGLQEVFKGTQALIAVGETANDATRMIRGLGIGIARSSGSAVEFGRVMTQLTQALSKGKLTMQDFRTVFDQLKEARGIFEEAFGTSDLEEMTKQGVAASQAIKALAQGFEELGAGDLMDTFANKVDNLKDEWLLLKDAIGRKIFEEDFKSILDSVASAMENLRRSVENISPFWRDMIRNLSAAIAKFALLVPAITFLMSRFLVLGGVILKYSSIVKVATIATATIGTRAKLSGLSMMSLAGSTVTLSAAMKTLGTVLRTLIPLVFEVYLAWELLTTLFPQIKKSLKEEREQVNNLAAGYELLGEKTSKLAIWWEKWGNSFNSGPDLKSEADQVAEYVGQLESMGDAILDDMARQNKLNDQMSEWDNLLGKITAKQEALNKAKQQQAEIEKALKKLGEWRINNVLEQMKQEHIWMVKKRKEMEGLFQRPELLNVFTPGQIDASLLSPFEILKGAAASGAGGPFAAIVEVMPQLVESMQAAKEGLAGVNEEGEKLTVWSSALGSFLGEGLQAMALGFTGMITGIKGWEKQFRKSILKAIANLLKLIATLAIAAVLMAIVFPGQGLKGVFNLLSGAGDFAKGGKLFGQGKGLAALFKAIGVPGGAKGMVVPPGFPNDTFPALLSSGEVVSPAGVSGVQKVMIHGTMKIRGRDLVYVYEENAQQLRG